MFSFKDMTFAWNYMSIYDTKGGVRHIHFAKTFVNLTSGGT